MDRISVEGERFQFGARQDSGECALGGDGAGGDGIHANTAIAPLDGQAADEGFDAGFGNGGRDDVGRADGRVGGRDAEDYAGMFRFEPATSAGHGRMERSHEHNADDGFEGTR